MGDCVFLVDYMGRNLIRTRIWIQFRSRAIGGGGITAITLVLLWIWPLTQPCEVAQSRNLGIGRGGFRGVHKWHKIYAQINQSLGTKDTMGSIFYGHRVFFKVIYLMISTRPKSKPQLIRLSFVDLCPYVIFFCTTSHMLNQQKPTQM